MANVLTAIMPKILARALQTLRQRCIMPQIVNGDYSQDAAEKGDTIDIPIASAIGVQTVTPSSTPIAPVDQTPTKVQIQLNNWYQSQPFGLTDQDLFRVNANETFIPMQIQEAVKALAYKVNQTIHACYVGIPNFAGTAGTTPFATTVAAATQARKILNQQLAPRTDRRAVLNFDAEANALQLSNFNQALNAGTDRVIREGEMGHFFGMDFYADDAVMTDTLTFATAGTLQVSTQPAVGDTTLIVKGISVLPTIGNLITIAGDSTQYVITAPGTLNTGVATIGLYPAITTAYAVNATITPVATHVVNLAFHRDAFAFATRSLESLDLVGTSSNILSIQDPVSGLVLRLEVGRQHKQTVWELDMLWGVALVRPQLACRILG